jgi:hypothetical protein
VAAPYTAKQRLAVAFLPPIAALLIRLLGLTLRYEDAAEPGVTPGYAIPGPTVYAFWHRSLLACAHRFRNLDIAILISPSFDGELIARTVELLGFRAIRGSSSRGGAAGLRNMQIAYAAGRRCAFTADGPRGPVFVAKPGAAQLANSVGFQTPDQPLSNTGALLLRPAQPRLDAPLLGPLPDSQAVLAGDPDVARAYPGRRGHNGSRPGRTGSCRTDGGSRSGSAGLVRCVKWKDNDWRDRTHIFPQGAGRYGALGTEIATSLWGERLDPSSRISFLREMIHATRCSIVFGDGVILTTLTHHTRTQQSRPPREPSSSMK